MDSAIERKILNLAAEVAEASDKAVPRLLLQLRGILDAGRGEHLGQIKQTIWSYDLLQVLVLSLKQDYARVQGSWTTAEHLVQALCKCCVGLDPEGESHEYFGVFLPDAVDKILGLARKLQMKYMKTSNVLDDVKAGLLSNYQGVLDSLAILFGAHNFLTLHVLKCHWLQQILMSEDVQTVLMIMSTIQSTNRMKTGVMGDLGEKVTHAILDELIYKLSASPNVEVASSATRTLLVICDHHPPMVAVLCSRYSLEDEEEPDRGLKPMLTRWEGKGFGRDLRKLVLLLESGSAQEAKMKRLHQAAAVIQAWWKSYYTRKKLKKADTAFKKFQRSFRLKQSQREKLQDELREQRELRHILVMRRRKAFRDLYNRRLETMKILPPGEIEKHLQAEQNDSAVKIQAVFRGYITRKKMAPKFEDVVINQAAMKIQRGIRRWLRKIHSKKREPLGWQRPPGLTDQRRVELQAVIEQWRELHPTVAKTEEERLSLHEKVQGMLKQHAIQARVVRKKQQHREALLAHLELDANLLMEAPNLKDVSEKDIESYRCYSIPIATRAQYNHTQEMRLQTQPWWRKLGDEYQDVKHDEEIDWKVF